MEQASSIIPNLKPGEINHAGMFCSAELNSYTFSLHFTLITSLQKMSGNLSLQ